MELQKQYENFGLSGLVNLGNTCFMNSGLQCLSNTIELTDFFLKKRYLKDINKDKNYNIAIEYYRLLEGIWTNNCTISPNSFHKTFQELTTNKEFLGFRQNDVQEFLIFFIDNLHEALSKEVNIKISGEVKTELDKKAFEAMSQWKKYFKSNYSKIIDLFYGQIISTTISKDEKYKSEIYTPMCYFTVPIPNNINDITVYDCFDLFTKEEVLDEEEKWYCEEIDEKVDAKKQIKFWATPKILIIHLKRFLNNGRKLNNLINFPLKNLDLSKYCVGYDKRKSLYNLYAISNHDGNHYYSYCLSQDKKWYCFNDSNVSEVNNSNLVSQKAYCLFYKKI